ncbi:HAD hydrolase-like protein [Enterococcus olivae]
MKKETILFDLDGTIINSSQGIFASINYAMEKLGQEKLSSEILRTFVGPPLYDSFMRIGLTQKQAEDAVFWYRELYKKEAMYLVEPYQAIAETLVALSEKKTLLIATSKPEVFATRILDHLNFSQYFQAIYGADLEGERSKKADIIQYALISEEIKEPSLAVMVGDREHDIHGATVNKMDSIGVLYGFGDQKELSEAGAKHLIKQPMELLEIIQ